MPVSILPVAASELPRYLPELTALLVATVNDVGVPLGFLPPITETQARQYWVNLQRELEGPNRTLLVALDEGRVVGSGQLALSTVANAYHRAEIQKLFVDAKAMGKGIGRMLMEELHQLSRRAGRPLVVLQTRRGIGAARFYLAMGYKEGGVVPGYTIDREGKRYDTITFYLELPPV